MNASQLDPALSARIEDLLNAQDIVLFMKGSREQPRCGFSAQAVELLNLLQANYETVDVLSDPEIREGIKVYADWPTIPQLYFKSEFVGGTDIMMSMFEAGELQTLLGLQLPEIPLPKISLSEAAAKAIQGHLSEGEWLRVRIDAQFRASLDADKPQAMDLKLEDQGVKIVIDRASAPRADGLSIGFVDGPRGGFKVENPNEPAKVRPMRVTELSEQMGAGSDLRLIDVRSPEEHDLVHIEGDHFLDMALMAQLEALPKDQKLVFYCHTGARSMMMAQRFIQNGFVEVYNLEGGIDAWSLYVDNSLPRY